MTRQFLDHSETEDRTLYGVMQDMEPDQARIQIAIRQRSIF